MTGRRVRFICRLATALVERPSGTQRVRLELFTNSRVNGILEKNMGRRAETEISLIELNRCLWGSIEK